MKIKNISARGYGINGVILAPLQTLEFTDKVTLLSIQPHIDSGDLVVVSDVIDVVAVEVPETAPDAPEADEATDAPKKRGRPAKTAE